METLVIVHPRFDADWPWAADHLHDLFTRRSPIEFIRLRHPDPRPVSEIVKHPEKVRRLITLGVPWTMECPRAFTRLTEVAIIPTENDVLSLLRERGMKVYGHASVGYWGQSVAEFGLALTLCGLRRIPQLHVAMMSQREVWNYAPPDNVGQPGMRGIQFGDDARFTCGSLEGKRVRIVGAGNIASRYASFCHFLGADVAAWDPFAMEPCFHRSGARKEHHLERLLEEAEIFAPMVPLTPKTQGLITSQHIRLMSKGCLVILVTRAEICDMPTLRERVLNDELALAADVFDVEPVPPGDPLLGRHNVVHTPHNAGRTIHANQQYAQALFDQFLPEAIPE